MTHNKIELLASANWTKINWDLSWQPIIELSALLPQVGESYEIALQASEAEHTKNGIHHLLWLPPHSELNGLDDRPTEVLKAYIVEAELVQGEWVKKENGGIPVERKFNTKIISVRKLMDYSLEMELTQVHTISQYFQCEPYRVEFFQWDSFYLCCIHDEYHLSNLLFHIDEEEYRLIFVNDWLSYCYDCYICNSILDIPQIEVIKKYLKNTNRLNIVQNMSLAEHQVQGALYY